MRPKKVVWYATLILNQSALPNIDKALAMAIEEAIKPLRASRADYLERKIALALPEGIHLRNNRVYIPWNGCYDLHLGHINYAVTVVNNDG